MIVARAGRMTLKRHLALAPGGKFINKTSTPVPLSSRCMKFAERHPECSHVRTTDSADAYIFGGSNRQALSTVLWPNEQLSGLDAWANSATRRSAPRVVPGAPLEERYYGQVTISVNPATTALAPGLYTTTDTSSGSISDPAMPCVAVIPRSKPIGTMLPRRLSPPSVAFQ
jgi:hypothetical protein